ncbi:MAG: A/G-specific adenine glycosylase [Promethearchaeota archaeon]|jgi:A/G-specific adenine glycosylase
MLISEFHNLYKSNGLSKEVIKQFQKIIDSYFKQKGRDFPFRKNINPYNVLVSEIMLQQTQTGRVTEKYLKFIEKFPDFSTLSKAPLKDVLKAWQGLGYNRRAVALKRIADVVITDYNNKLPDSIEILKTLPQIGHNTASSIITFAFNKPTVFVETNIRRVYIYFFFHNKTNINDKDIIPIVKKTICQSNPRDWYYALMDYGVMLKKLHPEIHKRSIHYRKQASFKGSNRQIRGELLKLLIGASNLKTSELEKKFKNIRPNKLMTILLQLEKEGFIKIEGSKIEVVK